MTKSKEKYNIERTRKLMSSFYSVILWYEDRNELPEDWMDYANKSLMLLLKELKINHENGKILKGNKIKKQRN